MIVQRPASLALIVVAAMLCPASWPAPVSADDIFETVYLPTSSVVGLPSATMLPTSYIVPTSYASSSLMTTSAIYTTSDVLVPTSTSYVVPTYRRVRYRPRRYVERTAYYAPVPSYAVATSAYLTPTSYVVPTRYLATSYVAPTSYLVDSGLVTTSASMSMCCESGSGSSPAAAPSRTTATRLAPSNGGNTIMSTPSSSAMTPERPPSGSVGGLDPAYEGKSSRVVPEVPAAAAQPTPPPPAPVDAGAPIGSKPGDEPDPSSIKIKAPGKTGEADAPLGIPKLDQTFRRDANRPAFPVLPEARNILRGKVVSFESRRPEESVTVILSSKTGSFVDKTAMTDAFGEFKVSLPTGDWVVKVKMPSGAILPVGQGGYLTASSGRITDPTGLDVPQFTITR